MLVLMVVVVVLLHCSLFKTILALNSVLIWKLLVFEFLLGVAKNFLSSKSALVVNIVLQSDVFQLLTLFVGALTYLEPKLFFFIIFHNHT
jgi:hypothetical protein